jgi:transposase-like protein
MPPARTGAPQARLRRPDRGCRPEPFAEFVDGWGRKYPAIVKRTTNAIESVNARIRRAVRARGHFPNEQAALKCV